MLPRCSALALCLPKCSPISQIVLWLLLTTGIPSSSASVENVGTALNPIFNFTIPKGDAGAIKFEIVQELPTTDIKEDTIYLVPYSIITVQELPTTGQSHTIYIVESTNKRYVYESSQWIEISSDNKYIEYIYVNNQWEELGGISVDIDLSDYYTKQETNNLLDNKADVSDIPDLTDYVKNTDYATSSTGGVFKIGNSYGTTIYNGFLSGVGRTYANYSSDSNALIICKGTLENVITGKDLTTKSYVDGLVGDIESILETLDIGNGV
jgi:hypothetical protein